MDRVRINNALKRIMLILPLLLVFGTLGEVRAAAELGSKIIPDDAVSYGGHYYKVYDDLKDLKKATWEKASKYCKKRGGHLAVITSPEEDEFVSDYLSNQGYKSVFFGLHFEDGEWKWVNDEPFRYSNWGEDNPDGGKEEPYGQYYKLYSLRKWNDGVFGFDGSAYVCEWDSGAQIADAETADAENLIEKGKIQKHGSSYYRVFNTPLTQPEAAELCENLGGHLAYINDAKEQAYINDLISKEGKRNMYWIGAEFNGSKWQWMNGESIREYKNWSADKPQKIRDDDICAVINMTSEKYDTGSWAAKPPEGTVSKEAEYYINFGFVCEWELICVSDEGEFITHDESDWMTKTENSCEDGGERYKYCKRCGEITNEAYTSPQPHEYERRGLIGKLSIPGYANFVCTKCGARSFRIEWESIWIVPSVIIIYILFAVSYFRAREDFEAKARSEGRDVLTKPLPRKLFVLIPIAAVLLTVLFAII